MISNMSPDAKMEFYLIQKENIFEYVQRKKKHGIVIKPKQIKRLLQNAFTGIMRYDR